MLIILPLHCTQAGRFWRNFRFQSFSKSSAIQLLNTCPHSSLVPSPPTSPLTPAVQSCWPSPECAIISHDSAFATHFFLPGCPAPACSQVLSLGSHSLPRLHQTLPALRPHAPSKYWDYFRVVFIMLDCNCLWTCLPFFFVCEPLQVKVVSDSQVKTASYSQMNPRAYRITVHTVDT